MQAKRQKPFRRSDQVADHAGSGWKMPVPLGYFMPPSQRICPSFGSLGIVFDGLSGRPFFRLTH